MPATPKKEDVTVSLTIDSPAWKVVEALRHQFGKTGDKGRFTRAKGGQLGGLVLEAILVNASDTTLDSLAEEAVEKKGSGGKEPTLKVKEVIRAIAGARPVAGGGGGAVDLSKLSDEALEAELKRREEAKKAGKGTKNTESI